VDGLAERGRGPFLRPRGSPLAKGCVRVEEAFLGSLPDKVGRPLAGAGHARGPEELAVAGESSPEPGKSLPIATIGI
jgi:hypothetical protein